MRPHELLLIVSTAIVLKTILAVAILLFFSVAYTRLLKRCSNCRHWNALYEANRIFDEYKWRTKIYKTVYKDSKGRITSTKEREGREKYRIDKVTINCSNCEASYTRRYEEGKHIGDGGISLFVFGIIVIGIYFAGSALGSGSSKAQRLANRSLDSNNLYESSTSTSSHDGRRREETHLQIDSTDLQQPTVEAAVNSEEKGNRATPADSVLQSNIPADIHKEEVSNLSLNEDSPELQRMEYATSMLKRGKSLREVSDSTFLTVKQVRRLRRDIRNNESEEE